MFQTVFANVPSRIKNRFRFAVLILLAIVSASGVDAQSSDFAPVSSSSKPTVSVRELQISSKAKANFQRGLQRLLKHDAEGSLKHFAAAIEAAPNFSDAFYHRGVAEALLSRNEEALGSFQAAIDLSEGHDPRAEFGYALVLCRVGSAIEAESVVMHGLQADPDTPDGHIVLALILLKLNRVEEAERSAQQALLLKQPGSAKAHLILADIKGARRDFEGQANELNEYLKTYPDAPNRNFLKTIRDTAKKLAVEDSKRR